MKPSGKFLTVIFAVLFIVLLGELGYIFYSSSQNKTPLNEQPVPTLTQEEATLVKETKENPTQAISSNMLEALAKANQGVLISSFLQITYQGNITELVVDPTGMNIRITGPNGKSNKFYYSPQQLSKVTVVSKKPLENERTINASDLKIGDLIRIEGTMDMLKEVDSSFTDGKITVVN